MDFAPQTQGAHVDDFHDMKTHCVQNVEINMYLAIWAGNEIDLSHALECARNHDLQLAFTIENITLRADRVPAHGITPTPCTMTGGPYEGKGNCGVTSARIQIFLRSG